MKYLSALIALALLSCLTADAQAVVRRNVVVQKTVIRGGGRNVQVEKIVVQQQQVHHQQLNVIAVPVQAYAAPLNACSQNFQSYSQPVVVERVVVQQQSHCQKFFH